jgi:beta-xylosidase
MRSLSKVLLFALISHFGVLPAQNTPIFDEFLYHGKNSVNPGMFQYSNPILPGCYPDPSICRVGKDYYLVNSTFGYYPGVPIWHSTDLVHWKQLGYVLNRPSQLMLKDCKMSGGVYAPDIKYNPHNRTFYMITTGTGYGSTTYVKTDDPKKCNWSAPVALPSVGGIDPSLFFDEDGKAYILNNDAPAYEPLYSGHRAIWIREFDWRNDRVVGEAKVLIDGGLDISKQPSWIEGPHLYKVKGKYYLMAAEGGTGPNHREVILSSDSPMGPFKPCAINPILTQMGLSSDRIDPITCAGHADLENRKR